MKKRRVWGICLVAFVIVAMAVWCVCTEVAARELAEALEKAKRDGDEAKAQVYALLEENAALKNEVDDLTEEAAEAELAKKLLRLPRIDNCTVSHYCCEKYEHICGTGSGMTASGVPVQADVSCAVDPLVIPMGSRVYVDYGDGRIYTYIAHDTGGAVNGGHIDVAVETHEDALRRGIRSATVWWEEG